MRSSTARLAAGLLALALLAGHAGATDAPPTPTRQQVNAELDKLRADPDLSGTHKQKTLRLKETKPEKKPKPPETNAALLWLRDFSRWMTEAGRVLVWVIAALVVAFFLVSLRYWVRMRAGAVGGRRAVLPSHVRELDIRPESLPDEVGVAAAALWQRGEHRAALSLLYRGALSRLVHEHAVPIRAASTEGECVALAAARLPAQRSAFFGRLVQAWQLAVYGARLPESASVLALCADFDAQFGAPQAA